ncbi:hypothetical protein [Aquibacillus kalidii]|uniref:hypothetical protein n=1 Tax=Aquibacillus kalidii TaxID=2762597 RepID=UPI0016445E22|nr:hypothetical protein [Aquibacillus kalidii]
MDNKTIDLKEWKIKKKKDRIIKYLEENGVKATEENIEKVEYELDFSEELQQNINESNLDKLIDKGVVVSSYFSSEKMHLIFPLENGGTIKLDIFVDLKGKLQTDIDIK